MRLTFTHATSQMKWSVGWSGVPSHEHCDVRTRRPFDRVLAPPSCDGGVTYDQFAVMAIRFARRTAAQYEGQERANEMRSHSGTRFCPASQVSAGLLSQRTSTHLLLLSRGSCCSSETEGFWFPLHAERCIALHAKMRRTRTQPLHQESPLEHCWWDMVQARPHVAARAT